MVDHRTQQTSQDLDYYYFVKPPPERNSSNPLGVHVDGKIMPQRDIDDITNGTDTWKELHGVDLYFAEEGALERSYASHQFDGRYVIREQHVDEPYPTSVPIVNFTKGTIEGYPWQYTVGNWPAGSRQTGIGDCFAEQFINISNSSELQDSYTEWPDGNEIEYFVQVGDISLFSYQYPYWAMGGFTPPMATGDPQKSDIHDFESNQPLYADNVRKVYWDLRKLQFYTLRCPTLDYTQDTTYGYNEIVKSDSWTISAHDEQGGLQPFIPTHLPGSKYILHEDSSYFDLNPLQRQWKKCEVSNGTYRMPYCGKYGRGVGYKSQMFGNEVALYAAFGLDWANSETSWENRYRIGFYKLNYTLRMDVGAIQANVSDVVAKAKSFANHYNARIPSELPTENGNPNCTVQLIDLFSVCRIGSRTDISSLDWKWSPNKNQ